MLLRVLFHKQTSFLRKQSCNNQTYRVFKPNLKMSQRQGQTNRTNAQGEPLTEDELRDQLHEEIERRARPCSNKNYECTLPRLGDYKFCLKHILQDDRAPYKQCAYVYPWTSRKCPDPAPILANNKRDATLTTYCFEHTSLVRLDKTRRCVGQFKKCVTNETLLADVMHHVKKKDTARSSNSPEIDLEADDEEINIDVSSNDPFSKKLNPWFNQLI